MASMANIALMLSKALLVSASALLTVLHMLLLFVCCVLTDLNASSNYWCFLALCFVVQHCGFLIWDQYGASTLDDNYGAQLNNCGNVGHEDIL